MGDIYRVYQQLRVFNNGLEAEEEVLRLEKEENIHAVIIRDK